MNGLVKIYIGLCFLLLLSGCELIEGVFKTGFWVGVIFVVVIIGALFYLVKKLF